MPRLLFRKLNHTMAALQFPCVPAACETICANVELVLRAVQPMHAFQLDDEFLAQVRRMVAANLEQGFARSANTRLQINLGATPPGLQLSFSLQLVEMDPRDMHTGEDTFGALPDQLLLEILVGDENPEKTGEENLSRKSASERERPNKNPQKTLDLGCGPGRNALAVARLGHPVVAVDGLARYIEQLQSKAASEGLPIDARVLDLRDQSWELPTDFDIAVASSLIPHFRSLEDVAGFIAKVHGHLKPGGRLLINGFFMDEGTPLEKIDYELAQVVWNWFCSDEEWKRITAEGWVEEQRLDFVDYEKPRQAHWPPTEWFDDWSSGRNLFTGQEHPPMRLYWSLLRKK